MSHSPDDRAIVYIVDDDEALRRALDRLFRSVSLETRSYGAARQFLDAQRPDLPGCIVLDVRLPGINGLEFQAQLGDLGINLPVVLITGHGDIPMTVRAMKAGAVDFLPKPFRDQDMLDAVSTAINRDRSRRAAERTLRKERKIPCDWRSFTPPMMTALPTTPPFMLVKRIAPHPAFAKGLFS
jgi:FixJ family two-component response regulator